jgi:hypothetical protein
MTRMRVLYREIELTGPKQAATLFARKIERSAEALRIIGKLICYIIH